MYPILIFYPIGDVLTVAEVAGVMAAQRSADLLPYRLSPLISKVKISCQPRPEQLEIAVLAQVVTQGEGGLSGDLEALTGIYSTGGAKKNWRLVGK